MMLAYVCIADDISLGPPKTVFASSRHNPRLADTSVSSGDPAVSTDDVENARAKFFSDRQMNRRSGALEKDGKDSWTRAAERRALGGDDESKADGRDRNDRFGRHDTQDGERRNGFGEKGDARWNNGRGEERRQNGDRPAGGWRDREARKNGDRNHEEKDPEWMDDPVVKKDQELNFAPAKSQDEFQKWKESMNKKVKGEPEKEEVVEAPPPAPESKPSLQLEGFEKGSFFGFSAPSGLPTPTSAANTPVTAPPAKSAAKGKTSRYASMFKPAVEETPPPQAESDVPKAANVIARTTAEDQEGFNRVLQMLGGGLKIGGQPTPTSETPSAPSAAPSAPQSPPQPTRAGANGSSAKPKSRFFQAQPKSPERLNSPQQGGVQLGGGNQFDRGLTEEPATIGGRSEQQSRPPQEPAMTPEPSNMFNAFREQQARPSSGRVSELAMFDPPSRSAPSPDINIQNLLAQQRQRSQHTSHESQNLLNLLKKSDPSQLLSRPLSQQTPSELQRWLDHQHHANSHGGVGPGVETFAPKPGRIPHQPPGVFEEQLMRNFPSREDLLREQQQMPPGLPEPRRQQQRAPPGFFDEREIMMQQQQQQLLQQQMRRSYAEAPPQQIPQAQQQPQFRKHQTLPSIHQQQQQYSGEYHITSPQSAGGNGPPGFSSHMPPRHPPGFGGNVPQQQQQHFQREAPPPGSMPPGFGPPPPQQQPPPPGFYGATGPPPPGFRNVPPPPGMRGGERQFDHYDMGRRGP